MGVKNCYEVKTIVRVYSKSEFEIHRNKTMFLEKILDLHNLDFARPFNVQISEEELSAEDIGIIADEYYKRADGQYVCNGVLASTWKVEADIRQKYIKLGVKILYVDNITQPVIQIKEKREADND